MDCSRVRFLCWGGWSQGGQRWGPNSKVRWHHRVRRAWRVPGLWQGRAEESEPAQELQGWTESPFMILPHPVGVSHILSTHSFIRIVSLPGSQGRARVERIWSPHLPVTWPGPWHRPLTPQPPTQGPQAHSHTAWPTRALRASCLFSAVNFSSTQLFRISAVSRTSEFWLYFSTCSI